MEPFDYDELRNTRLSKTVQNAQLIRARRHIPSLLSLQIIHLDGLKKSPGRVNNSPKIQLSSNLLARPRSPSHSSSSLGFDDINAYLKRRFLRRLPRVKRHSRSTQTAARPSDQPSLRDNNTVLELPSNPTGASKATKVYVNLANGFSSFHRSEVIEDKRMLVKFPIANDPIEEPASPVLSPRVLRRSPTRISTMQIRAAPQLDRIRRSNETALSFLAALGADTTNSSCFGLERELRLLHELKIDKRVFSQLNVRIKPNMFSF